MGRLGTQTSTVTKWLERAPMWAFAMYAVLAAFSTYFCMYAFRKPFTAATFAGESIFESDIALKTAIGISQLVGYTLSKYAGIKFVSEIGPRRRAVTLVGLITFSELALLLFAVLPGEWKILAIFFNGLPLGMVWGLVVWYLEGRRASDMLLAGLAVSFILASGAVKDIGRWLMSSRFEISESWMPFATGLLFLGPFYLCVYLLNQLPPPNAEDEAARTKRVPMTASQRRSFIARFLGGLVILFAVYVGMTAYRDFRDLFGVEIFRELGYADEPALFTQTELPVALGVLLCLGLLNIVKNNRRGLIGAYVIMTLGAALMGAGTVLLDMDLISGVTWMALTGLGSYLVYVPYNTVLFDRLIATVGTGATAVFGIYVADALGYTGSVGLQLYKDIFVTDATRLDFFRTLSYGLSAATIVLLLLSLAYFLRRTQRR